MCFEIKPAEKDKVFKSYPNADSIWLKARNFDRKSFYFQDLMKNLK